MSPVHVNAQEVRGGQVGITDKSVSDKSEVTDRRAMEEVEVLFAFGIQLFPRAAQLLVLHLEFDLVRAQLVQVGILGNAARDGRFSFVA